jgi:hypothetical protein
MQTQISNTKAQSHVHHATHKLGKEKDTSAGFAGSEGVPAITTGAWLSGSVIGTALLLVGTSPKSKIKKGRGK